MLKIYRPALLLLVTGAARMRECFQALVLFIGQPNGQYCHCFNAMFSVWAEPVIEPCCGRKNAGKRRRSWEWFKA